MIFRKLLVTRSAGFTEPENRKRHLPPLDAELYAKVFLEYAFIISGKKQWRRHCNIMDFSVPVALTMQV